MKRIITLLTVFILLCGTAWAIPPLPPPIYRDTDCNQTKYNRFGILCQDTDDGKYYKWSGTAMVEMTGTSIGGTPADGDCALYDDATATWLAGACPGAGTGAPTDGEYVTYSSNVTLTADRVLTEAAGIDLSTAVAGQIRINVDLTELTNQTWGAGEASSTHTFNVSGTTDPVWTVSDGVMNLSAGAIQQGGVGVQVQGNDIAAAVGNNAFLIQSDVDSTDTLVLQAYDVGSGWDSLITLTSSSTPTLALAADGAITISSAVTTTVESVVFTDGALSSVTSITDGTASWTGSSLSGFADITSTDDITVGDDLLLASGAVISWDTTDITLTHSANTLTLDGGNLAMGTSVITFGTDPADAGAVRLANNTNIAWEIATPGNDATFGVNASDDMVAALVAATDIFHITTGNLKVGAGTGGQTFDGADAYVTGFLEVDGMIYADGGVTGALTGAASSNILKSALVAKGDLLTASAASTPAVITDVAAGQPLLSGGVAELPAYAGFTFSGTNAATYTFPGASATLADLDANQFSGDQIIYDAVNDGNPVWAIGSGANERLSITATYEAGGQLIESVTFATVTADGDADDGEMIFSVDGTTIMTIKDGGILVVGDVILPSTNADPAAVAGALRHDSTVTNFTNGALVFYDGANIKQVVSMTTATATACTDTQVVAYNATDDLWYCKADETAAADATLVALAALSIADVSVITGTGADAFEMKASAGNNYILGSNTDNTALEFKTPANVLSQIGAQATDADLTTLAGLTAAEGKFIIGSATPLWDESVFTVPIVACTEGQIWKMTAVAGVFACAADEGGSTALDDIGDPDAATSITLADTETITLASSEDGGTILTITDADADLAGDTSMIDLKYTDDGDANGFFIRGYDNAGNDLKFSIGADGAASFGATTVVSLSASDGNITNVGDIAVDSISNDGASITVIASDAGTVTIESVVFTSGALTGITALDGVTVGDGGSTNYITISDTGAVTFTGSATFSASGATSSIPWVVGAGTAANTTEGTAYWESDTDILTIGDGASGIGLNFTANTIMTFPATTATLARTDAGQTFTGVQAFTAPTVATSITPNTAANASLGTGLLPFSSVFIGDAATNNVQLINTAAAGAVVLTLPSTTGTLALLDSQVFTTYIEAPYLIIGSAATAADAGGIRMPNSSYIMAELDTPGVDVTLIGLDATSTVQIGTNGAGVNIVPATTFAGDITVSGGNINSGNIAFTIGDALTDSITFTTDGTGNAELTFPADSIGDADIDWGSGAGQVDIDDVPDSATYQKVVADDVDASGHVNRLYDSDATGSITVTGLSTGRVITLVDAAQTLVNLASNQIFTGTNTFEAATSFGDSNSAGSLKIYDGSSNFLTLSAPALAGDTIAFKFPSTNGNNGEVLVTDGSGNTSWSATGAADVLSVGDCTGGACLDGTSDGGTNILFYDAQGATTLQVGNNAGAVALTLPITTSTLMGTGFSNGDGLIFGDTYPPDAAGEIGYSTAVLQYHDGTGARTVATLETAQNISGVKEVQDGVNLNFGTDADWSISYDETTTDGLIFSTAAIGGTTTNPMFQIKVNSAAGTLTEDQRVFQITNNATALFYVTEDGDAYVYGGLITTSTTDPAVVLDETTASDTDFWFGINADQEGDNDDFFAIGTGTTAGSNSIFTINPSGDIVASGTLKGTSLVLEGGTYDITIDADAPTANTTYSWPNGPPASSGYALTSTTGGTMSWSAITATAGGSETHVQYAGSGSVLAGEAAFAYNATNNTLSITQSGSNPTLQIGDGTYSWGHTPQVGIEGVVEIDGAVYADTDVVIGDDLSLLSDGAILNFGADNDVTLTHVADVGLTLNLDLTITGADITLISATAGAGITGGNGTLSLKGLGSGTDEIMTIDLNTANLITFTSTTDATFAFTPAVAFTGSVGVGTTLNPDTDGGASLGTTNTLEWQNLFLNTGAVINWENSDVTLTHSANTLTIAGGDLVVTTLNGHTFTAGSSTFTGTAGQTYTFPTTSKTVAATDGTNLSLASSALVTAVTDETGSASGTPLLVFNQNPTLVAPALGAATATSLLATGIVDGTAPVTIVTTSAGVTLGGTYKSGYIITNPTAAAAAFVMTLPTAAAGLQYCVANGAAKTGTLTVYTATGTQYIDLDGVLTANTGGVQASAVAGNFGCLVGVDATHWKAIPTKGTWTKVTR